MGQGAQDDGVGVVSMSLGGTFDMRDGRASYLAWQRVSQYANRKGTLIVAAAGNSGRAIVGDHEGGRSEREFHLGR